MTIKWISRELALAVHDEQLAEHGGGTGTRDAGLMDSALARPQNRVAYADSDGDPDIPELAAAYCFGIVTNHPFVDGNKRTGAVLIELFLELNGHALTADDAALVRTIVAVADGSMDEGELGEWVREKLR